MRPTLTRIFAATAVLLVAANVFAAKTDTVVLKNGDRFTGEVKELSRGQLKLSTDDAGTLYIEWDKIAAVTTLRHDEVVTSDGSRYVGALAPASADQLIVVADDGNETWLAFSDVVSVAPIKASFFERIDGSLDFGGSYTKSSGVTQTSLDLTAAYRRPSFNAFVDFESNLTRESQATPTSRFIAKSGYVRFRADQWIVSPFLYVERNTDLGLSLRSAAVLTAGRYLQRSTRSATLAMAGAAVGREQLIEGATINNVDAVMTLATSFYRYDYPRSTAELSLMVFPELNRLGRVRANANVKLKYEMFKDFFAATTVYDTFDSQPQVAGVSRNDIGVTLSLGWTF